MNVSSSICARQFHWKVVRMLDRSAQDLATLRCIINKDKMADQKLTYDPRISTIGIPTW